MSVGLIEHCGVFGMRSLSNLNVAPAIIVGLQGLQHRGQESFGIAVQGNKTYIRKGLVLRDGLGDEGWFESMKGPSGIGHVRYSTVGSSSDIGNFHPIAINSAQNSVRFKIAHNGTISNTAEMRQMLRKRGIEVKEGVTDTELAGNLLASFFKEKADWVNAFHKFDDVKNGSYCFVIITESGDVIAARDSRGYKPLCYGHHSATNSFVVASESFAFDMIGAEKLRDIEPGQLLILGKNGPKFHRFSKVKEHALDAFELTYFAHPASNIDGIQVALARESIGRALYNKFKINGDMVIPVPESAIYAAEGYAVESGIRLVNALGKDRYRRGSVLRSFIQQPEDRTKIVQSIFVIREYVRGKDIIVIDDSIVRGNSSRHFIELLRGANPRSISLLSTFPPIRHPCYMGIDFPSQEELIAHTSASGIPLEGVGANIAKALKIAFVGYLDPLSLSKAIGLPLGSMCFSCVTGDYTKLRFRPQPDEAKGVTA